MELLRILITALGSLLLLFLLCKLMGNKQISRLTLFDYTVSISIGSIAAELATELEAPLYPALAMTVYALVALAITVLTSRSLPIRRLMSGKPLLLMDNGVLYRENMRTAHLDLSEFLTLCRISGYYNVNDLKTAIFEANGAVSFLPKSDARPLIPRDMRHTPKQDALVHNVILDGTPLYHTLHALGHDERWLTEQLLPLGYKGPKDVYLATLDDNDKLSAYPMTRQKKQFSPFD